MKIQNIYIPAVALGLMLGMSGCDDNVMEWKDPDSTVKPTELPLEMAEKIARYDFIKNYMTQYHPNVPITVGMGLENYLDDEDYRKVVDDNFQGVTFGNAMKHQSIVATNGTCNWATVDAFLALNTGLPIHGHNLLWHTQQQQSYMKSLIAPKMVVTGSADGGIINVITNSDFEDGTLNGWDGWSHYTKTVSSPGHDSNYCLKAEMDAETAVNYDCQLWWPTELKPSTTYAYRFWVKSPDNIDVQFVGQNASYGGIYKTVFTAGPDWTLCEGEFEYKDTDTPDIIRIGIQFGGTPVSVLYVDDFEFGEKGAADPMINILPDDASTFDGITDGSTGGWGSWGSNKESAATVEGAGTGGSTGLVLINKGDGNAWEAQCAYTLDTPLDVSKTYMITFDAKCDHEGGYLQFQHQNSTSYGSQGAYTDFEVGTSWVPCEREFVPAVEEGKGDVDRIIINFGKVGGTYTIDNIKFGEKTDQGTAASKPQKAVTISYELKSPEEKKALLLGAMEEWIKEAMTHMGNACTSWDVINEPIGDNGKIRGVEGGWMSGDSEPVEDTTSGLTLNWANESGNGHFYWGYYCGMDYAVKAFQFARQYSPNNAKLYVNDYNLETSPSKLAKLIEFVKYIDEHGGQVDGIGTQMHVQKSITREQVDAMFQTMAKTGKLVRITELDVALGTEAKTAADYELQGEVYNMILTSYFENVPEAQQGGITIWSLTDAPEEHEYWLKGDEPNLFDATFGRKLAYKRVCDAIAGHDLGEEFESPDYSQK
ncbi:MAG: hypothetical protein HFJ91_05435 [Muribaculaceae bacterium]|nr:hypothetical protein [Muribaculaceae bacterium]